MGNSDGIEGKMIAYHFVAETLRDGRPIPADGEWLEHDGEVVICHSGLHASLCPFDALKYAPGNTLCLVELGGTIVTDDDKVAASRRKIIKRIDAGPLAREFARWCALQVVNLWDAPKVVRQYLATGDESLRTAALNAASSSFHNSAQGAAWCAAFDDACIAAWPAAWRARDAVSIASVASAPSGSNWQETLQAAKEATRSAQRLHFRKMVDSVL